MAFEWVFCRKKKKINKIYVCVCLFGSGVILFYSTPYATTGNRLRIFATKYANKTYFNNSKTPRGGKVPVFGLLSQTYFDIKLSCIDQITPQKVLSVYVFATRTAAARTTTTSI